jgi:hypothetical protein
VSECSAIVRTPQEGFHDAVSCRNGFPVRGACLGTAGTPVCCNEELCAHLYSHCGGWPKMLALPPAHPAASENTESSQSS